MLRSVNDSLKSEDSCSIFHVNGLQGRTIYYITIIREMIVITYHSLLFIKVAEI